MRCYTGGLVHNLNHIFRLCPVKNIIFTRWILGLNYYLEHIVDCLGHNGSL